MASVKQIFQYGLARIKTKKVENEYLNWLKFANAGMMNEGNYHLFELAIKDIEGDEPIIEIGSFCGLSSNVMTYFLNKYSKKNKIITSDKWIFEDSDSKYLGDSHLEHDVYRKFVKESFIRNIKVFSPNNLPYAIEEFSDDFFKLWEKGDTHTDILDREIQLGGPISFAFIDGNHSYEFTKRDFENCDKYLVNGGFILFDDSASYYNFGCSEFMKEMRKNKNYRIVDRNPNYLFQKIQ